MHHSKGINDLAAELLSLIFENCPRSVALSHVCRRWRNIALDCPYLWREIRVKVPERDRLLGERSSRSSMALFLDKKSLLHLSIGYTPSLEDDGRNVDAMWLRDTLEPLTTKIELENLQLDGVPLGELGFLSDEAFKSLRSLTFTMATTQARNNSLQRSFSQEIRVLGGMLNLRALGLNRQALEFIGRNHATVPLPWSQITHIEDSGLGCEPRTKGYKSYFSFIRHCLSKCTSIQVLKLSVEWTDTDENLMRFRDSGTSVTVLSNLETLTLEYSPSKHSSVKEITFLNLFRFPILKKLAIVAPHIINREPQDAMDLERHFRRLTKLKHLHLDFVFLGPGGMGVLLNVLPTVRTLSMRRSCTDIGTPIRHSFDSRAFEEGCPIVAIERDPSLLPQLDTLIIDFDQEHSSLSESITHHDSLRQLLHTVLVGEEESRFYRERTQEEREYWTHAIMGFRPHPVGWLKRILLVSHHEGKAVECARQISHAVGVKERFQVVGLCGADLSKHHWDC